MRSRVLWRRSATAAGIYSAALVGFAGQIVGARWLGPHDYGLFAIVLAATGFFQTLLDLTVEEAVIKYGFRYSAAEEWGKLRRLFARTLAYKGSGALAAGVVLGALAPVADSLFGTHGLLVPLLVAAFLPLAQAPEGLAGVALVLHSRYDVRAAFLLLAMCLRAGAIALGAHHGVARTVLLIVLAQVVSTAAVSVAGWIAFRRFPAAAHVPLGSDRRDILGFVLRSSVGSGIVSLRGTLAPLLLGIVTSPTQVAFFRTAQAPQQGFASLSAPARLILLTEQTRDWERGKPGVVFAGIRRFTLGATLLMAAALPPLLWFMPDLIRLAYTARYSPASEAARLILLAAALQLVVGWTKSLPVSVGRPGLRILTHGIETIVLLPLVLVLGALWGATGAAGAVLAATCVFVAVWAVVLGRLRREGLPPRALGGVAPS